jgi:hypothetical protein
MTMGVEVEARSSARWRRRPPVTSGRGRGWKRAFILSGCRKKRANDEGKRGVAAERKEYGARFW